MTLRVKGTHEWLAEQRLGCCTTVTSVALGPGASDRLDYVECECHESLRLFTSCLSVALTPAYTGRRHQPLARTPGARRSRNRPGLRHSVGKRGPVSHPY